MVRRSVLFSPGDQPALLRKAPETGADVVVFDLEDAVVPAEKDAAREAVSSVLSEHMTERQTDCEVCVRINPLGAGGESDLETLADGAAPDSIMLPKVTSGGDVQSVEAVLAERGLQCPLLALLETAGGILEAPAVADCDATDALLVGGEDLAADIGATRTEGGTEILYARQRTVLAAARAGIDAIDTLHTDFEDPTGLAEDAAFAAGLGFDGKMAIHPSQVEPIHEGFTPDPARLEWAERVLTARDEAEAAGSGVFEVDGEMIDAPLITQAETILERAGRDQS